MPARVSLGLARYIRERAQVQHFRAQGASSCAVRHRSASAAARGFPLRELAVDRGEHPRARQLGALVVAKREQI